MVPAMTHPTWPKLIKGERKHQFSQASASMLLFSLQQNYRRDPAKLDEQVAQAHRFFVKYESLLAADIRSLFE